jgi:hypothetical protein
VIIMAGKKRFSSGTRVDQSGQYKNTSTGTEVTCVRGEPFPPTPKPGQKYVLANPTKHKQS